MKNYRTILARTAVIASGLFPAFTASAQTVLSNQYYEVASLSGASVEMYGRSELRVSDSGTPLAGCTINLHSVDSWVFLPAVAPSSVAALLDQFQVDGAGAVLDSNVRVVQYGQGAVVIPHPAGFQPLTVYDGENFSGTSMSLSPYTQYSTSQLGAMASQISSFVLKRGYTATFAQNANGTGLSRNYVAADGDLEIGAVPEWMDGQINFVRVFPWRWTSKKGSCDVSPTALDADWHYNWNISTTSTLDWEYAGIRQTQWWPSLSQDWAYRGINHLSGFNEPDSAAQANLSVAAAISFWKDLLATGLRVGAPAVTDGGYSWISSFISEADAAGYRVDYVPVHYYRGYSNNDDPAGAATAMYNFLKSIHDMSGRPVWVTEFNNGANWTTTPDPTYAQNKSVIEAMVGMMDSTPWIERYAIYSNVESVRKTHYDNGSLTPMGQMYKDHVAPIAYTQEMKSNRSRVAGYSFEGDCRDDSGCGNHAIAVNIPVFAPGKHGQAIELGGSCKYVQLPGDIADSASFTFAAWVYWNGGSDNQRIFDFGNYDLTQYMVLTPRTGGQLGFAVRNGAAGSSWLKTASALPSGSWQHVAVTMSGSTAKIYLNGVQQASGTLSASALAGTAYNYLGKSQWSTDPQFSGKLDEVQIADYAMTQTEIAALMNNTMQMQLSTNLVVGTAGEQGVAYSGSVAGTATDPDASAISYVKVYGPSWLTIAPDGTLSGTPGFDFHGQQLFTVRALDAQGESRYFMLSIDLPMAGSGTWTADLDGLWSDAANWSGGFPANGAGYTADFSTINISANRSVTLNNSLSVGGLKFSDTSGGQSWTIADGGEVLTLDSGTSDKPNVYVINTATLETSLSGINGFWKSGSGTLILAGSNSLSGTVYIDSDLSSGNNGAVRAAHPAALANVSSIYIRNDNAGYSTLQLDGTLHGGVTVPAMVDLDGRTVNVAAIRNLGGENRISGVKVHMGGGYYILQSDAGTLEVDGSLQSVVTGTRTFTIQGAGDTRLSGIVENGLADTVNVVKSGTGRLLLENQNTYSGYTTVSGGELVVDGTAGAGTVTVGNEALLSGGGSVAGLTAQTGSQVRVGVEGFSWGVAAPFTRVDNFEDYTLGTFDNSGSSAYFSNGGPWYTSSGISSFVAIGGSGVNKYLAFGYNNGLRAANRAVPAIADGETGTYCFQVFLKSAYATPNVSFGLSDNPTGALASTADFEAQVTLAYDAVNGIRLNALNGGSVVYNLATHLHTDTWYNIRIVADNATDTYDVYFGPAGAGETLVASNYSFRSAGGGNVGDLITFMTYENDGGNLHACVDNIYYSAGENMDDPLDPTIEALSSTLNVVNDFSLQTGAVLEFDVSSPSLYDRLVVGGAFNAGGTLKVLHAPEQPALQLGDRFDLFDAAGGTVGFAALELPALAAGLLWDTSSIASGVLQVVESPDGFAAYMSAYGIPGALFGEDENSNGIPNGAEYYLGWNPTSPVTTNVLFTFANDYLSVVHPFNPSAIGVTGIVEWTTDLLSTNWYSSGITYVTNSAPDEIVADLQGVMTNQLFIRLRVDH